MKVTRCCALMLMTLLACAPVQAAAAEARSDPGARSALGASQSRLLTARLSVGLIGVAVLVSVFGNRSDDGGKAAGTDNASARGTGGGGGNAGGNGSGGGATGTR